MAALQMATKCTWEGSSWSEHKNRACTEDAKEQSITIHSGARKTAKMKMEDRKPVSILKSTIILPHHHLPLQNHENGGERRFRG